MLDLGYSAVQMGTRFIATEECTAHADYKKAIVDAQAEDIVLTERLSGVPCAIINTPFVAKSGTKAGPIARWMLRGRRTKKWMRTIYALRSLRELKQASMKGQAYRDYWQAGRSVEGIRAVEPADAIVRRFAAALRNYKKKGPDPFTTPRTCGRGSSASPRRTGTRPRSRASWTRDRSPGTSAKSADRR